MLGQHLSLDESRPCKQDGMIQEEADLATLTVTSVYHIQEVKQLEEGHVGMDIFDVGLQESVLQRAVRYAQGALALEVGDLILADLVGQWLDPGRQERQRVDLIGLVQVARAVAKELHGVPGNLAGVRVWAKARPLDCFGVSLWTCEGSRGQKIMLWSVYVCAWHLHVKMMDRTLQVGLGGGKLGERCACVDQGKASVGRWDVIRHQRVSE